MTAIHMEFVAVRGTGNIIMLRTQHTTLVGLLIGLEEGYIKCEFGRNKLWLVNVSLTRYVGLVVGSLLGISLGTLE